MGVGNITEVLRDLEEQQAEKLAILQYFQNNKENKKEVDKIISNERYNFKLEERVGNIWSNVEILTTNIDKINQEIALYESLNKSANKFRR